MRSSYALLVGAALLPLSCAGILGYGDEALLRKPADAGSEGGGSDSSPPAADAARPGVFVAVGYGGRRVMSRDGLLWENNVESNTGTESYLNGVSFGKGQFVAVGYDVFTSPDGVQWTRHTRLNQWLGALAFGKDQWIGAGGYGWRAVSTNGSDWVDLPSDPPDQYGMIVYGDYNGGRWIAHRTFADRLSVTDDGNRWTEVTGAGVRRVAFGAGVFAGISGRALRRSIDGGITWTPQGTCSMELDSIAYGSAGFVAIGRDRAMVSSDGVAWTEHIAARARGIVTFGGGYYMACDSTRCARSSDGVDWAAATMPPSTQGLMSVTYGVP